MTAHDGTCDPATLTTPTTFRDLPGLLATTSEFQQVAESLRAGQSGTIDGAWGSSQALALAALYREDPPLLTVVAPSPGDVDSLVDDLRTFGCPAPAVLSPIQDIGQAPNLQSVLTDEGFGRRLAVLKALTGPDPPRIVVTTIQAILQPLPTVDRVRRNSLRVKQGETHSFDELIRWLTAHGWERREAVEMPGEISVRGGILDVFAFDMQDPLRIEFFGDEVDSIREFSAASQRSLREVAEIELTALFDVDGDSDETGGDGHLADVVPPGTWFALLRPNEIKDEGKQYLHRLENANGLFSVESCWQRLLEFPTVTISSLPHSSMETVCTLQMETVERFSGELNRISDELDRTIVSDRLILACHNQAEVKRLHEILDESRLAREGRLTLTTGLLHAGFRWVTAGLVCVSDHEVFHRAETRHVTSRRFQGRAIDSFVELRSGDHVVHLGHGIGIFRGMKMIEKSGQLEEHLTIEFANELFVYVPASKIHLVQKYVGSSKTAPRLSKVGGLAWQKRKQAAQKAVADLASDLIDVQASRQTQPGIAYPADTEWLQEFVEAFEFVDTPDQVVSWRDIRGDMETTRPMDRLLCGDVGFGKTELAMRAAFKAVDFGKQVAVLVPTTVLAQQHLRTFRERMAEFPFRIECVSRFKSKGQQRRILKDVAEGKVDVLIGTHRLLSADVSFQDIGLVIVDEEQRFGVAHKERLKHLRSQVEILTMTATPIPRTLHASLLGIRDISNLETPPANRLPVETRIIRFEDRLVRHAILRELNRGGQIYFVHNRVQDIKRVRDRILQVIPEARIAVIHGQMHEHEIEDGMVRFIERRADILLATTIIESGLDIPNANTIFINDGDRYGLADLHQLRGRVGRSHHRAYCYVVVDDKKVVKPDAQRRLKAIEEYSALGSGFQIALRDLEIRGAGNILGAEQSGHIAAVGYELYCQLLENAVRAEQKQPLRTYLEVTVELPWKAYLPQDFLPGERMRIDAYRRLGRITTLNELKEYRSELVDRFGSLPPVAANFMDLSELRILAQGWQIDSIRPDDGGRIALSYRNARKISELEELRNREIFAVDNRSAYIRIPPAQRNATGYCKILKRLLQPN